MAATTTALVALAAGSAISSYLGSRNAAKGVEAQGKYEQSILEQNAKFAEQNAADVVEQAGVDELRHKAAIKGLIGTQRTVAGAADIDINSGSIKDIQNETDLIGEIDALTIRNNAARQAWGYKVEAADLRNRGKLARMGALNQASAIRQQGYTTLLTGAAQVASYMPRGSGLSVPRASGYSGGVVNGMPVLYGRR